MSNRRQIVIGVDPGATGAWSVVYVNADPDTRIRHLESGLIPYRNTLPRLPGSTFAPAKYDTKHIDRALLDAGLPDVIRSEAPVSIIVEEPPVWVKKKDGKTNGAGQVVIGRYMEAIAYMMEELLPLACLFTVPPLEWQNGILRAYIPKVVTTDIYTDYGIHADRKLDTKQRAYLACAIEFGPDWMPGKRSQSFRSAVSDATCIALYGCMRLGIGTTNLSTHPDALKQLYTRKAIPARSGESDTPFGNGA